jgi:hypothetical protein
VPEYKLSMAKLQGHFLKYRDHPLIVICKIDELASESDKIKEMSIAEMLRRLNLHKYAGMFAKMKLVCISDMR